MPITITRIRRASGVLALIAAFLEDSLQCADCLSYLVVRSGVFYYLPHCVRFFSQISGLRKGVFPDLSLSLQPNRHCKSRNCFSCLHCFATRITSGQSAAHLFPHHGTFLLCTEGLPVHLGHNFMCFHIFSPFSLYPCVIYFS